ncbi:MAG: methyltransferase domain-containing protein [Deltaproteobacteria bacterium]|nr:methyltransferase domain-containing protein [Deltaproteobacteria bacterium]
MDREAAEKFDRAADAMSYDSLDERYMHLVQKLGGTSADYICDLAEIGPGDHVLDLGTGTGLGVRTAARRTGSTGRVVGLDLSPGLIEVAKRHTESEWCEYVVGDAEDLPFEAETFDVVFTYCAVAHFPRLDVALSQMRRVLKPGGRVVVSFVHTRPIERRSLALHYARRVVQKLLEPIRPTLFAPATALAACDHHLPELDEPVHTPWSLGDRTHILLDAVAEAGFVDVRPRVEHRDVEFDDPDEFLEAQEAIASEVRVRMQQGDRSAAERTRAEVVERARTALRSGGRLIYPFGAYCVFGRKPA